MRSRLTKLYEALETTGLTMQALSPRILSLRQREDQLAAAREDAARQLTQRKVELPTSGEIRAYMADFRSFLEEGTFPERKALIRNFVQGIEVSGDEAELTYTIPMPAGGVTSERAAVLDFVQSGPPCGNRTLRPSAQSRLERPARVTVTTIGTRSILSFLNSEAHVRRRADSTRRPLAPQCESPPEGDGYRTGL